MHFDGGSTLHAKKASRSSLVDLTGTYMALQGIMQHQLDHKLVPYPGRSSLAPSSCASEVCGLPSDYCKVCVKELC